MSGAKTDGGQNRAGLSLGDYKGSKSTLCPGCGHDAITGSIVQAAFEAGLYRYCVGPGVMQMAHGAPLCRAAASADGCGPIHG